MSEYASISENLIKFMVSYFFCGGIKHCLDCEGNTILSNDKIVKIVISVK